MPLARPTIAERVDRTEKELAGRLGLGTLIPRGPLAALARVIAGACHLESGRIAYEVRQIWPNTADATNLDSWGSLLSEPRKVAVAATGNVVFAGSNGTVIPLGATVQRADGQSFRSTATVTIVGGAAIVPVIAIVAGVAGNTTASTTMQLTSTVVGTVTSVIVDSSGLDLGADQESDENFRRRLVQRFSQAPGAGTIEDYERWALEVPGVTRAWVLPANQGAGTVGLTFVLDDDPVSIIPSATKVAEMQAYILARRPEPTAFLAFAPTLVSVNFTIHVVPDTTDVRTAVADSLQTLFESEGGPSRTIPLSHLREAISLAPGETDHVLSVPAGDLVLGGGQIPVVGTITWV